MGLITWMSKGVQKRLVDYVYPVGSIYESTSATNPGTLFGGTWETFGAGRVLIGAGQGNDGTTSMSFTAGSSGGKYKIKLTESQLPKHTHNGNGGPLMIAGSGDRSQIGYGTNASYGETNGGTNCKNEEIDIMTPYQTIYRWKRVS